MFATMTSDDVSVTMDTEQTSDFPTLVIMVDGESFPKRTCRAVANRTASILSP